MTKANSLQYLKLLSFLLSLLFISCTTNSARLESLQLNLVQEYILLSDEYIELKEYGKALELLEKANKIEQKNENIIYKTARAAALNSSWSIAIDNYSYLLSLDPENITIQKSIAWISAQSGDIELSQNLYAELYEAHDYDKEICTNYILVLVAGNEIEQAKLIFDAYSELYPDEENLEELFEAIEESLPEDIQLEETETELILTDDTDSDKENESISE